MSIEGLTQAERLELPYGTPLHLVEIELATTTLRLCDRDFRYIYGASELFYASYISQISGLGDALEIFGTGNKNSGVTLTIKNEPWAAYSHLCKINAVETFDGAPVTIYELRILSSDETFASDVRTVLWKGTVEQLTDISEQSFDLICSGRLFGKSNGMGLSKVTAALYSKADPNDIGKYRNCLYGDLEFVPARCVETGAIDTISADMTATQVTISLSGITRIAFPAKGTVKIGAETIKYKSRVKSGGRTITLKGCTRGASSTTAVEHKAGSPVFVVLTRMVYELADHPVKSISNVYVNNVKVTTGFTAYTGQSGDELTGYEGRAVIKFTVQPTVSLQWGIDSTHEHDLSESSTRKELTVVSSHDCDHPEYACDGSYDPKFPTGSAAYIHEEGNLVLGADGVDLGEIKAVEIHKINKGESWAGHCYIHFGGVQAASGGSFGPVDDFITVRRDGLKWTDQVVFSTSVAQRMYVWECYLVYHYIPAPIEITFDSISSGLSMADVVFAGEVTADVQGYQDDALGTYTGTANALIERPDQVITHMLVVRMGFTAGDIGTSFATSGALYATDVFKFAFILHDVGTAAESVFASLATQCRSSFFDFQGLFELFYIPTAYALPAPFTIGADDVIGLPKFSFTGKAEIRNKINVYYRRDYRSSQGETTVNISPEAKARGFMDMLTASAGAGDREEDLMLMAVRTAAHATKIRTWALAFKGVQRRSIDITAQWRAIQSGLGQWIAHTDAIYGACVYLCTSFRPYESAVGQVHIEGVAI